MYWQDKWMVILWRCSFEVIASLFYRVTSYLGRSHYHRHTFSVIFHSVWLHCKCSGFRRGGFRLKLNLPCFSILLKSPTTNQLIGDHSVILWIYSFKCFKTRCANSFEPKLVLFVFSLYHCIHSLVFPSNKSLLCPKCSEIQFLRTLHSAT